MKHLIDDMISKLPELSHGERVQLKAALDNIGDLKQICDIIESTQDDSPHCPHCEHTRIHKHGTSAGLQRYKCVSCGKTFNALTNTPLARMRKKELWLAYMECMMRSYTLRIIGAFLNIDKKTAFLWRHHFSSWLYKDSPEKLEGVVEADETYYRISHKGCRHLKEKAHKRGGDGAPRGLSKKKVCVLVACDRSGNDLEYITGLGPVKGKWLDLKLTSKIAADAVLVTDGHQSYAHFCKKGHIDHVVVVNKKGLRTSGCYHIQHVNSYHGRLRNWINDTFHGVATKYLNHYLWWRHELENNGITDALTLFRAVIGAIPQLTCT